MSIFNRNTLMNIIDWRTLNLNNLDILICAGTAKLSKKISETQRLTGASGFTSQLTHLANIMVMGHNLYAQESTTLNKWCGKTGVQLNPFELWLKNYPGRVYIRQPEHFQGDVFDAMDLAFWEAHKDLPYESGIPGALELLTCALRLERVVRFVWRSYKPLSTKSLHCTELVAKRLKHHFLLENRVPENRLPPHVWWSDIDEHLTVPLGKPVRIK